MGATPEQKPGSNTQPGNQPEAEHVLHPKPIEGACVSTNPEICRRIEKLRNTLAVDEAPLDPQDRRLAELDQQINGIPAESTTLSRLYQTVSQASGTSRPNAFDTSALTPEDLEAMRHNPLYVKEANPKDALNGIGLPLTDVAKIILPEEIAARVPDLPVDVGTTKRFDGFTVSIGKRF